MDALPSRSPEHLTEAISGWRVWNLSMVAGQPRLEPAGSGVDSWIPGRAIEARCGVSGILRWGLGKHRAPELRCRCGIYACRSLDVFSRPRPAWPPAPVVGTVSLWGTVIEHEQGWRGQYAYPSRVRLVCAMCAWFEPGSWTPVAVHSFGNRVYTLCATHRGGIRVPDGRRTHRIAMDPTTLESSLTDTYAVDLLPEDPARSLLDRPPTRGRPLFPSISVVAPSDE